MKFGSTDSAGHYAFRGGDITVSVVAGIYGHCGGPAGRPGVDRQRAGVRHLDRLS